MKCKKCNIDVEYCTWCGGTLKEDEINCDPEQRHYCNRCSGKTACLGTIPLELSVCTLSSGSINYCLEDEQNTRLKRIRETIKKCEKQEHDEKTTMDYILSVVETHLAVKYGMEVAEQILK